MPAIFALVLLAGCKHQYLAIPDAEVIAGTPQYAYSNVWVGTTTPTYALTQGSLDLTSDTSATLDVSFAGPFDFTVTEIVFLGLTVGGTDFGNHWKYTLSSDEIAAKHAEITIHALSARPTREFCTPKHLGTWTCFQVADDGVKDLGMSAAGSDTISLFDELPVNLDPMTPPSGGDACSGYTIADCCTGGGSYSVVECAWTPSCKCPDGTSDLGYFGDGNRRCGCPG